MNLMDIALVALVVAAAGLYTVWRTVQRLRGRTAASCCGPAGSSGASADCASRPGGGCSGCHFAGSCADGASQASAGEPAEQPKH